jgi:hypothetical protein
MVKLGIILLAMALVFGCGSSGSERGDSSVGFHTLENGKSVSVWQDGGGRTYYRDETGKHFLQ